MAWEAPRHLGTGGYATVAAFQRSDREASLNFAVKKVENVFTHAVLALRTLREVRLLAHFRHPNVLSMLGLFVDWVVDVPFQDIYICLEFMDHDLAHRIHNGSVLLDNEVQRIIYQVLRGLLCLHTANVVHRDLKPSNVLVQANGDVKIADLGLGRSIHDGEDGPHEAALTEYVMTRYYRAPEVMITVKNYTRAVDVWSAGCILGEMLTRQVLFRGQHPMVVIDRMITLLAPMPPEDLDWIPRRLPNGDPSRTFEHIEKGRQAVADGEVAQRLWRVQGASPLASDLLEEMLRFHPDRRIDVFPALTHQYLAAFDAAQDQHVATARAVEPIDWSFDRDLCFDEAGRHRAFRADAFREAILQTFPDDAAAGG
eukprot:CAMPEP_0170617190 /NCGR_PEP_ID=MMETSP0224-20130122/26281_1 /TAXON_ID=285029 /ORGANISM="Togula jolla, Strain CCCM 725" /LENGTH=369 /DNA_ID=CAMNT_0010943057 /DNA_START=74 /DNA_END=1183 /DNA_ORIENTATION=-